MFVLKRQCCKDKGYVGGRGRKNIFLLVTKLFCDEISYEIFLLETYHSFNPAVGESWLACAFHNLFNCRFEKVSNGGSLGIEFSRLLFVYFILMDVWGMYFQMEVIDIWCLHWLFIICIFFLMAVQMFNSDTDWLFTISWWLTVQLAQPVFGCLFSNGGCQCLRPSQNWLPNLTLAGNQDTRIPYFF